MNSNEIFKQTQKIKVDTDTTDAILTIIDNKINQDMKEVITEVHKTNEIFNTKFDQVNYNMKLIFWVISIATAVITFAIFYSARK